MRRVPHRRRRRFHCRPDDIVITDALVAGFLLLMGVPCLVTPRAMQALVLRVNEHMGHVEPHDGFTRSTKYLRRLRQFGGVTILSAMVIAFADDIPLLFF